MIDPDLPALAGKTGDALLDSLVFAGNENPVRDVMVGGRRVFLGQLNFQPVCCDW